MISLNTIDKRILAKIYLEFLTLIETHDVLYSDIKKLYENKADTSNIKRLTYRTTDVWQIPPTDKRYYETKALPIGKAKKIIDPKLLEPYITERKTYKIVGKE